MRASPPSALHMEAEAKGGRLEAAIDKHAPAPGKTSGFAKDRRWGRLEPQILDGFPAAQSADTRGFFACRNQGLSMSETNSSDVESVEKQSPGSKHAGVLRHHHAPDPSSTTGSLIGADLIVSRQGSFTPQAHSFHRRSPTCSNNSGRAASWSTWRLLVADVTRPKRMARRSTQPPISPHDAARERFLPGDRSPLGERSIIDTELERVGP